MKMKKKYLFLSFALLLTSCVSINNASKYAVVREGEEPDPTTQSFTIEDTIHFESPYSNLSIRDINADIVKCIQNDIEEKEKEREEDTAAFRTNAIRALSSAASIGTALYTENYSSISPDTIGDLGGSVMLMLGFEEGGSFLNPNARILNALQTIQTKLEEMSEQISEMEINLVDHINNLSQNLQSATNKILDAVTDAEVRERFSNSLTMFQAAKGNWDHFVTSQYVPLQNKCNDFLACYTNYFGQFLDDTYANGGSNITLYFSEDGGITLPRGNIDYDIMGHKIAKTETVTLPLAEKTFAKINSLGGTAYNLVDLDIFQDWLEQGVDKEVAKNALSQLRLLASKSYFKDFESIQAFFNAFLNFGEALTGMTLDGVDASNMNPIQVYHSLLASVYNFGFETEDEITALVAKLARVYYSASYINDMARMFVTTNIYEDRFKLIDTYVINELTLEGRTNPNVGQKFYSYDIDSYVQFEEHELELQSEFYSDNSRDYKEDELWCQDEDDPDYKQTKGGTHVYLDGEQIQLSIVEEKSVSYADFEMMKIKYIHNILPSLEKPISFGTYLMQHGVINDPTKNIVFALDTLYGDDEHQNVANDSNFNLYLTGEQHHASYEGEPGVQFSKLGRDALNDTAKVVVSGKVASFDTDIGISGQFVLGVGYIYYDMDDKTYVLDAYSSHPEKIYPGNDMSKFINILSIDKHGQPFANADGALGFVLSDLTDCYILTKTSVK